MGEKNFMAEKERIFITYRPDRGGRATRYLYELLTKNDYSVFYNNKPNDVGYFNEKVVPKIKDCNYFLLLLSSNALDRCTDSNDAMRLEIESAIDSGKKFIAIADKSFRIPERLPRSLKSLGKFPKITIDIEKADDLDRAVLELKNKYFESDKIPKDGSGKITKEPAVSPPKEVSQPSAPQPGNDRQILKNGIEQIVDVVEQTEKKSETFFSKFIKKWSIPFIILLLPLILWLFWPSPKEQKIVEPPPPEPVLPTSPKPKPISQNNSKIEISNRTIVGNNNVITGNNNKIIGNNNVITGNNNKISGNNNDIYGVENEVVAGNNNDMHS